MLCFVLYKMSFQLLVLLPCPISGPSHRDGEAALRSWLLRYANDDVLLACESTDETTLTISESACACVGFATALFASYTKELLSGDAVPPARVSKRSLLAFEALHSTPYHQ